MAGRGRSVPRVSLRQKIFPVKGDRGAQDVPGLRFQGYGEGTGQAADGLFGLLPVDVALPHGQMIVEVAAVVVQVEVDMVAGVEIKKPFLERDAGEHVVVTEIEAMDQARLPGLVQQLQDDMRGGFAMFSRAMSGPSCSCSSSEKKLALRSSHCGNCWR